MITHRKKGQTQRSTRGARFGAPGWLSCGFAAILLLLAGCASAPRFPAYYYLQRTPVRVAVLPSGTTTDHPEASIVFDKACEGALRKKGFEVISADQVLTYASSRGLSLHELSGRKASEIGRDLRADLLFSTEITSWKTTYILVQGKSEVAGKSRLTEATTDALVWNLHWKLVDQSGGGGIGALVSAAVTAIANSAFDKCDRLGEDAARYSVDTLPRPGFAPAEQVP